jgi:hypothetical protein
VTCDKHPGADSDSCMVCIPCDDEQRRALEEIGPLRAELNGLRQMEAAVRRERDEARSNAETLKAQKQWVIDRIEAECRRAGFELQWTDGGGAACPGGWHRNPYLNLGDVHAELAEARNEVARVTQAATVSYEVAESERKELEAQVEALREALIATIDRIKRRRQGMHYGSCATVPRELPRGPLDDSEPVMGEPGPCDCGAKDWAAKVDAALAAAHGGGNG